LKGDIREWQAEGYQVEKNGNLIDEFEG